MCMTTALAFMATSVSSKAMYSAFCCPTGRPFLLGQSKLATEAIQPARISYFGASLG